MFRKTIGAVLGLALMITPAFALSQFYQGNSGQWTIEGYTGGKNFCSAKTYWDGGASYMSLFNMQGSDVFSLMIHNEDWYIGDSRGLYDLVVEFNGAAGYDAMPGTYELKDRQTIIIRDLTEAFLINWIKYREMTLVMPGNIQSFRIGLIGTSDSVDMFSECIEMLNGEVGD